MTISEQMKLIKKIHEGSDNTCFAGILKAWDMEQKTYTNENLKRKSEIKQLQLLGHNPEEIGKQLDLSISTVKRHIREYNQFLDQDWLSDKKAELLYDKLFPIETFYKMCEQEIKHQSDDCYFTVNSFWNNAKSSGDIRHLNCFVLDFDFYAIKQFSSYSPQDFYDMKLIKRLPFTPTAVIDSGRGLYILYAFKNCSYHMSKLYKAITKSFYNRYGGYGLDPKAMNLTQVIRIPGTLNTKCLSEVRILEYRDTQYTIQQFAQKLLPYTLEDVQIYRQSKPDKESFHRIAKNKTLEEKAKRKPYFNDFLEDLKQLIYLRNKAGQFDKYRECLLYLLRERACWSGFTIDESVRMAHDVNKLFKHPLNEYEVEHQSRPSSGRQKSSIETIILLLHITYDEFEYMKVLRPRWRKKQEYAKKGRQHSILKMSDKQFEILKRRTFVYTLKYIQDKSNVEISNILGVDKSTITRDIKYIDTNKQIFIDEITVYVKDLEESRQSEDFKRRITYDEQKQLLEWLKNGYSALDFFTKDGGVAKI